MKRFLLLLPLLLACAGSGNGGPAVTVEQCQALLEAAKVAAAECQRISEPQDRASCERYSILAADLGKIGCTFIEQGPSE